MKEFVFLPVKPHPSELHPIAERVLKELEESGGIGSRPGQSLHTSQPGNPDQLLDSDYVWNEQRLNRWDPRNGFSYQEYLDLSFHEQYQMQRLHAIYDGTRHVFGVSVPMKHQETMESTQEFTDPSNLPECKLYTLQLSTQSSLSHAFFFCQLINIYNQLWLDTNGPITQAVLTLFKKQLKVPPHLDIELLTQTAQLIMQENKDAGYCLQQLHRLNHWVQFTQAHASQLFRLYSASRDGRTQSALFKLLTLITKIKYHLISLAHTFEMNDFHHSIGTIKTLLKQEELDLLQASEVDLPSLMSGPSLFQPTSRLQQHASHSHSSQPSHQSSLTPRHVQHSGAASPTR